MKHVFPRFFKPVKPKTLVFFLFKELGNWALIYEYYYKTVWPLDKTNVGLLSNFKDLYFFSLFHDSNLGHSDSFFFMLSYFLFLLVFLLLLRSFLSSRPWLVVLLIWACMYAFYLKGFYLCIKIYLNLVIII